MAASDIFVRGGFFCLLSLPAELSINILGVQNMVGVSLVISGCACGDKDIFPAVDKGEAGQAQAGFAGVAGFSAQDFTAGDGSAVQGLEHGADKGDAVRVDISRGGGIAACGEYLTEFLIARAYARRMERSSAVEYSPSSCSPVELAKRVFFMPSSSALRFIRIVKASSEPDMALAKARQHSAPEGRSMP